MRLDGPFERSCSIGGVEAPLGEERLGPIGHADRQAARGEHASDPFELNVHDLPQLYWIESMKDDRFV